MNSLVPKLLPELNSLRRQSGINMVDLMMWLVIAAILLAASIQGIGYYREAVIMYYLKSDTLGAASNVKASSAQNQGELDQSVVDGGIESTEWSEGTTRIGKSHTKSVYSITAGNVEVTRSVVYCSDSGITVVPNASLSAFTCGGSSVSVPPSTGAGGDTGGGPIAGGETGSGGDTTTSARLAGWGWARDFQLGNGPLQSNTVYGPFHNKTITKMSSNMESCALADGVLWCWTRNTPFNPVNKQLSGPLAGKVVTEISVGGQNTCVIADGEAYCWGLNDFGQLGNGSNIYNSSTPVKVDTSGVLSGKTLKGIAASLYHVCAVDTAGKVYCWGKNTDAALGNGNLNNSRIPVAVSTGGEFGTATVSSLALSPSSSCALDTIGRVYCWGFTTATGTYTPAGPNYAYTPTRSANTGPLTGKSISQIYQLMQGFCGLSDGLQYCWGENVSTNNNTPALRMSGLPAGAKVIDGADSCVLMDNGKAYCIYTGWQALYDYVPYKGVPNVASVNNNPITDLSGICIISEGQPWCASGSNGRNITKVSVDVTTVIDRYPNPVDLNAGPLADKKFSLISAGTGHSCGIADESMYCWGKNSNGQLGDGTTTNAQWPVAVNGVGSGVKAITTGGRFTCVVTASDTVSCWGLNSSGQLGNGTEDSSLSPVTVGGLLAGKTVTKIKAGDAHVCALDTEGKVYCWGEGYYGQLGNGSDSGNSSSPILISNTGALAGKTVTDLIVGDFNSCVIADSVPYCWGPNWSQEFNDSYDPVLSPVAKDVSSTIGSAQIASMSVSGEVFCILTSDSKVYCWGDGGYGELGDGTTDITYEPRLVPLTGTVTQLSAGSSHFCALASGTVSCWGAGWNGQLGNGGTAYAYTPTAVSDTANVLAGKTIKKLVAGGDDTFVIYE